MTMYAPEYKGRELILSISRKLVQRNFVDAEDVCISYKICPDEFLTTAAGIYLESLSENLILKVDSKGHLLEDAGFYTPSEDFLLHAQVFRDNPSALAVIHAQPPFATAFAAAGRALTEGILPKTIIDLGVVPIIPYAKPGSEELSRNAAAYGRTYNAALLEHRGVLAWGGNLFEAYQRLVMTEQYARTVYYGEALENKPLLLSQKEIDILLAERKKYFKRTGGVPEAAP